MENQKPSFTRRFLDLLGQKGGFFLAPVLLFNFSQKRITEGVDGAIVTEFLQFGFGLQYILEDSSIEELLEVLIQQLKEGVFALSVLVLALALLIFLIRMKK